MAVLQEASGLGRGSLYNFFPEGKEEMAQAVLDDIDGWFQAHIFTPLRAAAVGDTADARIAVRTMFAEIDMYFRSGSRICLLGAFAISHQRDRFAHTVGCYFTDWIDALTGALTAAGTTDPKDTAFRCIALIQGGIVLARALNDPAAFTAVIGDATAMAMLA